ncbi:hypothetical protein DUNSADRAFT_15967 [Dunaliella salina]|uniref:Encoded protein n=1 Tax=Dunaliella salina TaxID=3046 RepID=A0ABQ7G4L4_DUNSA|nr:hypothetical protein DUNSADRAFT_15967 [Dunaliella salina]|eukprot:KAF5829517.1 hypothetical protein DUNSADRAFT_15967 [Dunaliella salina]
MKRTPSQTLVSPQQLTMQKGQDKRKEGCYLCSPAMKQRRGVFSLPSITSEPVMGTSNTALSLRNLISNQVFNCACAPHKVFTRLYLCTAHESENMVLGYCSINATNMRLQVHDGHLNRHIMLLQEQLALFKDQKQQFEVGGAQR